MKYLYYLKAIPFSVIVVVFLKFLYGVVFAFLIVGDPNMSDFWYFALNRFLETLWMFYVIGLMVLLAMLVLLYHIKKAKEVIPSLQSSILF